MPHRARADSRRPGQPPPTTTMTNQTAESEALLSQVDRSKLTPGALDALRAELEQLLEYAAQLRALPLDGIAPALGPQRWT